MGKTAEERAEQQAQKQEAAVKKQQIRDARQAEKQEAAAKKQRILEAQQAQKQQMLEAQRFAETPAGQARAAYANGAGWFEIEMDIRQTGGLNSYGGTGSDSPVQFGSLSLGGKPAPRGDHISVIEAEGWDLHTAAYVYMQTGEDSRDKWTESGQRTAIRGKIVGMYLFKRRAADTQSAERPTGWPSGSSA